MKVRLRILIGTDMKPDKQRLKKNMVYGTTVLYVTILYISRQIRSLTESLTRSYAHASGDTPPVIQRVVGE